MPKETRVNRFSSSFSWSSPYPCSSSDPKSVGFDRELGSAADVKQWEEIRCPICLDHPHNGVLLRCSSFKNGCRPYVCNTGVSHSNCLEQFCKLLASGMRLPETSSATGRRRGGRILQRLRELHCPLCRGEIHGWSMVEPARKFMNSKPRNCSYETCDFAGNFAELRRHARSEHPFARPSEADPERQRNLVQMEHQRTLADLISMSLDHSLNNLGYEDDVEDLSIDDIEEAMLSSMNEEEEDDEERAVDFYPAYFMFRYITGSNVPTNAFPTTMNTANGEDNVIQNNSSRRSILPATTDRRDEDPTDATLNHRQNNEVGSFTERVCWVRQSSRSALRRPSRTTTRRSPRRRQRFA